MRRAQLPRMDRLIAAGAVVVCGVAIAACLAVADDPPTREQLHDPGAAQDLVASLRNGEKQRYVAQYEVTRERNDGSRLAATLGEAHAPEVLFTRGGDTLRIQLADRSFDCELVDDKPACFRKSGGLGLPLSSILQTAIAEAPYDVLRRSTATIAGEPTRCFSVTAHKLTRQLPDIGRRATYCVARDGIVLRADTDGTGKERRHAVSVVRAFDRASLKPVLAGFETVIPAFRQ